MIVAGCDVGSLTAKAVILKDNEILSARVLYVKANPGGSALEVMDLALKDAGLKMEDIEYTVGTGYGRNRVPFANRVESEITCHGKGAWWKLPSARTVIDVGGQDAKAIRLDEKGNIVRYAYNDKCASGTGRFLEVMADALEVAIQDMGELAQKSREQISISNQCVVFAETEIISLINEGRNIPDIINALHNAMANRIVSLAKSITIEKDIAVTGGVAKNIGLAGSISRALKTELLELQIDPQINGALGAALLARDKDSRPSK